MTREWSKKQATSSSKRFAVNLDPKRIVIQGNRGGGLLGKSQLMAKGGNHERGERKLDCGCNSQATGIDTDTEDPLLSLNKTTINSSFVITFCTDRGSSLVPELVLSSVPINPSCR